MRCQRAARTRRLFAGAIATLALGAAVLAPGCGSDSEDTTSDGGPAGAGVEGVAGNDGGSGGARRGDGERGTDRAQQGGPAQVPEAWAALRSCLARHGVRPPEGGDRAAAGGDLPARLDELRSAMRKCRGELPKSPQAGGGSAPQLRQWRRRADRAAARQARRVEAFRACMGRHGFGPEADGNPRRGDLRKAFAQCQGPGTSAPGK
jgi:hypothetical protein